jgi:Ca-activated chloride channel family protein
MPTLTLGAAWPLALLAALPLVWLLAWRNRTGVARSRVAAAAVLRSLALAAIAVALARPMLHRTTEEVSVVYALDVSASISRRFLDEALEWIGWVDTRHQPAQSRVVVFADRPELVASVDALRSLALSTEDGAAREGVIDRSATNLEEGLLAALPGFAPGLARRVVLISDGNQTEGDAWRAMLRLQAEGARVFAVPAPVAGDNDAWVERIHVPPGVRQQASAHVEAWVFSRRSVPARVDLVMGEGAVASRTLSLSPGSNRVAFVVRFPRAGAQTVTVRVSAQGDELQRNDALVEEVLVQPRPHALYVEGGERGARYLADALTAQGIRVSAAAAANLSDDPRLLDDKDVVILSDVRADSLGTDAVQRLRRFVRDRGGGLIFAAGQNTYGQEGFRNSEIEQLLPVTFEAKRKHEDLDMVLLVDRSSSMRGQKIEVSKSAALATLDLLDPEHRLAVVAFDAQPHDVVPLMTVGDKREAENLISRMTSSGQTNIYNALLRAQALLAESKAKTKHIILLSDGLTSPPPGQGARTARRGDVDERIRALDAEVARQLGRVADPAGAAERAEPAGFPGLMEELADAGMTLSTVAIGEKPDVELMANLARWGGGRSYVTRVDAEVPTLFAAETRRLLSDAIVEERFRPRVKAWSPALAGVDLAGAPELRGYVASKAKRFSDVLLEVKDGLPLLVETRYGLGKTVGFLSDVKNRWAADWLGWPGYGRLWAQVVRDCARRETQQRLSWDVTREGREARIHLTAVGMDGSSTNALWPEVRVTQPDGRSSPAALRQVAPGRYLARVPLAPYRSAPWRFELLPGPGMTRVDVARAGGSRRLFYSYPDEYRILPANLPLLRALSEQTGGRFAPRAEEIFQPLGDGGIRTTPLWPYCTAAALALFLLDILLRRAPWRWRRRGRAVDKALL